MGQRLEDSSRGLGRWRDNWAVRLIELNRAGSSQPTKILTSLPVVVEEGGLEGSPCQPALWLLSLCRLGMAVACEREEHSGEGVTSRASEVLYFT